MIPAQVASAYKIAHHREKVSAYLSGKTIAPVSLEMDLTSRCSRSCRDCPSSRAEAHWDLDWNFIQRLFDQLTGNVFGLLLTGGEPTISPLFPATLALARDSGFIDIAVVTNGSSLLEDSVTQALLAHASTIRLSLYDLEPGADAGHRSSLKKIEHLRRLVEQSGSKLQIGVSLLTSASRLPLLQEAAGEITAAGAHWIYFHPRCRHWDRGRPAPEKQLGVEEEIMSLQRQYSGKTEIHFSRQRYRQDPIEFNGYHAAHFLMIIGADRKNYLGAEVKYHPGHVLADLNGKSFEAFLRDPVRLSRIASYNSRNYGAIASRHRGVLYNDFIEKLIQKKPSALTILDRPPPCRFPHVL